MTNHKATNKLKRPTIKFRVFGSFKEKLILYIMQIKYKILNSKYTYYNELLHN
jgi:hypothetical protein